MLPVPDTMEKIRSSAKKLQQQQETSSFSVVFARLSTLKSLREYASWIPLPRVRLARCGDPFVLKSDIPLRERLLVFT